MVTELNPNGTFLLNTTWTVEELDEKLPAKLKRQLAAKNANFYIINGTAIAGEIGLGNRINTVLQAAFFKLANIIPIDQAVEYMKACLLYTSFCLFRGISPVFHLLQPSKMAAHPFFGI